MTNQKNLDQFYKDITTGGQSDSQHEFVKGNNIYFHATNSENAESILLHGFDWENNEFKQSYFGKSFYICKKFADHHPKYTIFAVDLNNLISDESKKDKFLIENGVIKVKDLISPNNIIGYIQLP
ncbi:hypothetical protein D3C78_896800 [compost metagenome]